MQVTLIDKNTNGSETILKALSLCRDKQCTDKTIDHCITAKPIPHLSALEFIWFVFQVDGLSVKARVQHLRHRLPSTMERSTRSINMEQCTFVVPPTAKNPDAYIICYEHIRTMYQRLIKNGETLEDAAYILPLGTGTKFTWALNGRMLFDYLKSRLCKKHVQAEHYQLARELYNQAVKELPQLKYAHPCRDCGECGGE